MISVTWKSPSVIEGRISARSPLTVDDVIFTIERVPNVPNSPNSFAQFTRPIESLKKVDDYTLIVKTKAPTPNFLGDMTNVFIVSAKAARGATTADFNSGKAAIGTGQWVIVSALAHGVGMPVMLLGVSFALLQPGLGPIAVMFVGLLARLLMQATIGALTVFGLTGLQPR